MPSLHVRQPAGESSQVAPPLCHLTVQDSGFQEATCLRSLRLPSGQVAEAGAQRRPCPSSASPSRQRASSGRRDLGHRAPRPKDPALRATLPSGGRGPDGLFLFHRQRVLSGEDPSFRSGHLVCCSGSVGSRSACRTTQRLRISNVSAEAPRRPSGSPADPEQETGSSSENGVLGTGPCTGDPWSISAGTCSLPSRGTQGAWAGWAVWFPRLEADRPGRGSGVQGPGRRHRFRLRSCCDPGGSPSPAHWPLSSFPTCHVDLGVLAGDIHLPEISCDCRASPDTLPAPGLPAAAPLPALAPLRTPRRPGPRALAGLPGPPSPQSVGPGGRQRCPGISAVSLGPRAGRGTGWAPTGSWGGPRGHRKGNGVRPVEAEPAREPASARPVGCQRRNSPARRRFWFSSQR